MGIELGDDELRKFRAVLDQRDIGFMRYMPLVMQLQGVQMMEFINPDVAKIARMVVSRDLTKQQLQQEIDPRRQTNMELRDFTNAIKELRSDDFTFDDTQAKNVFLLVTGQTKPAQGVKMEIAKFIDLVFQAVHAVLVDRMQAGLKRSNKYLSDLLASHDKNKDGFLDYGEFESMLLEIQISFKP